MFPPWFPGGDVCSLYLTIRFHLFLVSLWFSLLLYGSNYFSFCLLVVWLLWSSLQPPTPVSLSFSPSVTLLDGLSPSISCGRPSSQLHFTWGLRFPGGSDVRWGAKWRGRKAGEAVQWGGPQGWPAPWETFWQQAGWLSRARRWQLPAIWQPRWVPWWLPEPQWRWRQWIQRRWAEQLMYPMTLH